MVCQANFGDIVVVELEGDFILDKKAKIVEDGNEPRERDRIFGENFEGTYTFVTKRDAQIFEISWKNKVVWFDELVAEFINI